MIKLMLIAGVGGFVGTCGRFAVGRMVATMSNCSFPLGTLGVNIVGCLLIGIFYGLLDRGVWLGEKEGLLLITGLCGGFTTFSAFADELWRMGSRDDVMGCVWYVAASVVGGVAMVAVGRALVRWIASA